VPNQESSATLLRRVTYRDKLRVLEGDSIAELGNKASALFELAPEVVPRQREARSGIARIPDWNRGFGLEHLEQCP
jgi:hypothetical protein